MEVKDRIKQKAEELFRKYGVKSVTMDEIASQLGVSKKTIYQFFKDKDELVDAVIAGIIDFNQQRCDYDRLKATNPIHELFLAMEMIKELFENMNPSIMYDLERNHPKAFQRIVKHKHEYLYDILIDNMERGIAEGLYREDITPDIIAKLRLETMMLSFNQDLFPRNKYQAADVEQQLLVYYLFGIASLKGFKLIMKYQQERSKKGIIK